MPVNLDADIRNADWTKARTNDLPPMKRREELVAVVRDISHWLRDLPSANPSAVHSVWHLLTGEEQRIYSERRHREGVTGLPTLRRDGSVVLSLREAVTQSPLAAAVISAFESASARFNDDADTDALERSLAGLGDDLLESLRESYIPAVIELVHRAEDDAAHALTVARSRNAQEFRSAARRRTPASVASARRYALSRALRLVDDLSSTARSAARDILSRSDLQQSTRIRRLRAVIGLNERQHESFMRSMSELPDAKSRTYDLGNFGRVDVPADGLTTVQLHSLADRYAAYLLNQRATLIARTEDVAIREETRRALWEREEPAAHFSWVTNEPACEQCQELDGTTVRAGEEYAPGIHVPPAHPGCDCTQAVRIQ